MLENLLNLDEISANPLLVFVWAFIIGIVGIMISMQVGFNIPAAGAAFNLTGLFAVLFIIIPSVPFIIMLIKNEEMMEEEAISRHYSQSFWDKHGRDVVVLLFYFAGITLSFALSSFFLPYETFHVQLATINEIRGSLSGSINNAAALGGQGYSLYAIDNYQSFLAILLNNLQVMMFSFLFSFAFGAGAVFIIVWNAAILGVFIGQLSKNIFELPFISLLFIPHGIPEIAAYLLAGLAGGIISAAIVRKIPTHTMETIILDAFKMMTLAVALVFIAAGIEVYL